jgi:signal recognition particle GTPase
MIDQSETSNAKVALTMLVLDGSTGQNALNKKTVYCSY